MPRVWTGKEDIRAITKDARSAVIFKGLLWMEFNKIYLCIPKMKSSTIFLAVSKAFIGSGCHTLE